MKREISLEGKNVLVTGGATGLGYGIATELKDIGANVIIVGRRAELLEKAAKEIGVEWMQLDICDQAAVTAAVDEIEKKYGPLYGLVNNAGVQNNKPALDFSAEELEALIHTNVTGTYQITREVGGRMAERGTGSIVFITSSAVHLGLTNNLAYSTSKGGLSSMVRALASELSPKGVRVNAIAPGWIETDIVKESLRRIPERRKMVENRCMIDRLGAPKDIGMAAAFLLSEAAAYITAVEIKVDGGIAVSL